ncbi:serine hydrolase domain-containing protein [Spirosoma gilvum]
MYRIIGFIFLISVISCTKEIINPKNYGYTIPQAIEDNIPVRDINLYNLDTTLLAKLTKDLIDEAIYNVHSVLIYKDGALFYEKYFYGKDEKHGKNLGIIQHSCADLHDVRSISKSVVSACIGIAIRKRLIKDENEPLKNFFPEICKNDNEKSKITIKNLLTMSSGLCWKEIGNYNSLLNDETKMDLSFNPIRFVVDKQLINAPGSSWNYSGGNTQVLAEIIKKVSGKNIYEFATEHLFQPLGINQSEWINLTMKKIPAAASGLRLTSRDLLKVGITYKDNGTFNNTQVLDSAWVTKSMAKQIERPDFTNLNLENGGYGYQFWTYDFTIKNNALKVVEAKGNGGQSIFICRQLNLVAVITAGNYGKLNGNKIPYQILKEYILPALL